MWINKNKEAEKKQKKRYFFKKRNMPQMDLDTDIVQQAQEEASQKQMDLKPADKKEEKPEQDVFVCKKCGAKISKAETVANKYVCKECGYYFRIRTKNRIRMVADAGTFEPWFEDVKETNPPQFPGYEESLRRFRKRQN